MRAPSWVGLLIVLTGLAAASSALVFSTNVGEQALVDQWERTALALGQPVDDARYEAYLGWSRLGWAYGVAGAVGSGPVLACGVAGALFWWMRRSGRQVALRSVLAVVVHAGVILALERVVAAPLVYIRETTASATSLGSWFPGLDEASPLARLLGSIDLFVVWWAVVLGMGVAVLCGQNARTWAARFVGIYLGLALLIAAGMAITTALR